MFIIPTGSATASWQLKCAHLVFPLKRVGVLCDAQSSQRVESVGVVKLRHFRGYFRPWKQKADIQLTTHLNVFFSFCFGGNLFIFFGGFFVFFPVLFIHKIPLTGFSWIILYYLYTLQLSHLSSSQQTSWWFSRWSINCPHIHISHISSPHVLWRI